MICGLDQGTSSTRFMVFDLDGTVRQSYQMELSQIYPSPGFVEHDPMEILESCIECINNCIQDGMDIKSIGITNQRETTIVWDKISGKAICNANFPLLKGA